MTNHRHLNFSNWNHKIEHWNHWQEGYYKKTDKSVVICKDCSRCLTHSASSHDENSDMIYHYDQQCVKFNQQSTLKQTLEKISDILCH